MNEMLNRWELLFLEYFEDCELQGIPHLLLFEELLMYFNFVIEGTLSFPLQKRLLQKFPNTNFLDDSYELSKEQIIDNFSRGLKNNILDLHASSFGNESHFIIPENSDMLSSVNKIILSSNSLERFPSILNNFSNIEALSLASNNFVDEVFFPKEYKKIKWLSLSNNPLNKVPENIRLLKKIETLNINYTNISKIDFKVFHANIAIEELSLTNNKINVVLNNGESLLEINYLDLSNNVIEELHGSGYFSNKLKALYLENNRLERLPDDIDYNISLQILDLSNNKLKNVPEGIFNLTNLISLRLENNQLENLGDSISKLLNIEFLYLESNNLKILPDSITELKNLRELYLDSNQLLSLPLNIGDLKNLSMISLFDNQLRKLPSSFSKLNHIIHVNCANNLFEEIPECIKEMKVSFLDFENNPVKEIPRWIFENEYIMSVNLQSSKISESFFDKLDYLGDIVRDCSLQINLYDTMVKKVPKDIRKLSWLEINIDD
jgi:Leucine-rich repeat (LRR) protein